jgi:hypothetical protein
MANASTTVTVTLMTELDKPLHAYLVAAGWTPPGEPTPENAAVSPVPKGMSNPLIESVMASTRQMVVDEIVRAIEESDLHFDGGALSKKIALDLIRLHAKVARPG